MENHHPPAHHRSLERKIRGMDADIDRLKSKAGGSFEEVENLIGRVNHASYVMPITRHYLTCLQATNYPRRHVKSRIHFGTDERSDLELWKKILRKAWIGMSLNLIVTRELSRICWSDACPLGIGGYSISGRAWTIQIPKESGLRTEKDVNNLLEFISMVVNIWLECIDAPPNEHHCILSIGDNTSAIGWLYRTSRIEVALKAHEAHHLVARKLAEITLE